MSEYFLTFTMRPPLVDLDDSAIVEQQIRCLRRVDPAELPPNWLHDKAKTLNHGDLQQVPTIKESEQKDSAASFPSIGTNPPSFHARTNRVGPVQRDGRDWQGKRASDSRDLGGSRRQSRLLLASSPMLQRLRPKQRPGRRLRQHIASDGRLHQAAVGSAGSHGRRRDRDWNASIGSGLRTRYGAMLIPELRPEGRELISTPRRTQAYNGKHGSLLRIFHAVLTTFSNHATRCQLIMKTWGSVLPDGLIAFYSDQADESLPVVVMQGKGYLGAQDRFTYKVLPHAYGVMRQRNASWLFMGDDDTFLWPENMQRLLRNYDPAHWVWLGQRCSRKRSICGGAGFAMSLPMVEAAACVAPLCWLWNETNHPYDIRLSVCLSHLLYAAVSNRVEFNSQAPAWYFKYWNHVKPKLGPGRAVTYHYMLDGISTDDKIDAKARQHYLSVWMLTRAAEALHAETHSENQTPFEAIPAVEHTWPEFGPAAKKLTANERRRIENKPMGYHSIYHGRDQRYRRSQLSKSLQRGQG